MKRRPKTRRVLKWMSTVVLLLCLATATLSVFRSVSWPTQHCYWRIGVSRGFFWAAWQLHALDGEHLRSSGDGSSFRVGPGQFDMLLPRLPYSLTLWTLLPRTAKCFGWKYVTLPFTTPLVLLVFSTALFWWVDRRRPPLGHCQRCGYDLTGNVSGRCPECGEAVDGA